MFVSNIGCSSVHVLIKMNLNPSFCSKIRLKFIANLGCSDDIMTSDHSPLFSNFQVGVRGQYVSNEGKYRMLPNTRNF